LEIISQELLSEITNSLVSEFAPEQIYLFGSHAWGEPGPDSDIDLLVIVSQSDQKPIERGIRARRRLRHVPAPIDVLVKTRAEVDKYRHVHASLTAAILEEGKLLYG
jgi:predicted nucleotidyltransferase